MFRLADPEDLPEAIARIRALAGRIPGLVNIAAAVDQNRGPAAYDAVLISQHNDWDALRDYATHPEHVAVLDWLESRWTGRVVVDTEDLEL